MIPAGDFARLAAYGRRLKGRAQGLGSGADIFLVNAQHQFIRCTQKLLRRIGPDKDDSCC
jgi:hypothetical protein